MHEIETPTHSRDRLSKKARAAIAALALTTTGAAGAAAFGINAVSQRDQQISSLDRQRSQDDTTIAALKAANAKLEANASGLSSSAKASNDKLDQEAAIIHQDAILRTRLLNEAAAAIPGATEQALLGQNLRSIDQLPGFGIAPSSEQRAKFEAAAVGIMIQGERGSNICTAYQIKLSSQQNGGQIHGQYFVLTAAHCFPESQKISSDPNTAVNIVNLSSSTYELSNLNVNSDARETSPLGTVTGISVLRSSDIALLQFNSSESLKGVNSIDANLLFQPHVPQPGEQIAMYGATGANNDNPVVGTARYIGRIPPDGSLLTKNALDIVAYNSTPQKDAGNFGASGALAAYSKGFLGPESFRASLDPVGSNSPDNPQIGISSFLEIEKQTGVSLNGNTVVVGYAALPENSSPFPELVNGLRVPAQESQAQSSHPTP